MTPRRPLVAAVAAAAVGIAPIALTPAAHGATASALGSAIAVVPSQVTGSALVSDPSGGQSTMVGTTPLAGFPTQGSDFAILSSGKAANAYNPNSAGNLSTQFGGGSRGSGNDFDVTVLRLDVNVPAGTNCMTGVDFRFLSEEFPEYVGDSYNDAFIAELDSTTWTAVGGSISAPGNFAFDPANNVVSINAAGAASMSAGEAAGTTYDGATPLLTAATPVTPGAHSFFFSIFDQGDSSYDSTVLIDNMRFGTVADVATDCRPGAKAAADAPEPLTPVSAVAPATSDTYGTSRDTYTIPSTTGVVYLVGGVVKPAGTYAGTGTVTVTAEAEDGYVLTGTDSFELVFSAARTTPLTSSGAGTAHQSVQPDVPGGATLSLLDGTTPVTTLTVPGEGTYTVDSGTLVFAPALGFSGPGGGVAYRVTDGGDVSDSTYTPTVIKPAAPAASPRTSTGTGTQPQTATVTVPTGGTVSLQDVHGHATDTVVLDGVGTYTLDPATGKITFTPTLGYSGTAPAVTYVVTDAYGQTGTATYQTTVTKPAAPTASPRTTTGTGTQPQTATVSVPTGGTVSLQDAHGHATDTVVLDGVGTYTLDPTTGKITFTPTLGYSGTAPAVTYVITDAYGQSETATYQATVTKPTSPAGGRVTSTGTGTTVQSTKIDVPVGGSVLLRDAANEDATEVTLPGTGTYVLDRTTGTIMFVPAPGYHGAAPAITYAVTDAYGQVTTGTYEPTVIAPEAPSTQKATSRGSAGRSQATVVEVPTGGALKLVASDGTPTDRVTVKGQGTYRVNPSTGEITFTPVKGFEGKAAEVTFWVIDSYGQHSASTYTARVTASPRASLAAPKQVRNAHRVTTSCALTSPQAGSCTVTAYAVVHGERVAVGHGKARATGKKSVRVPVQLTKLGRALAARPNGVRLSLASVTTSASGGTFHATTTTRTVAPTVALRPVYFDTDQHALRSADQDYLAQVRSQMGQVRSIVCVGYADARASVRYNARLARSRAEAACAALAGGRSVEQQVVSRGESRPAASNSTGRGRALNRRVEIRLLY